MQTKHLVLSIVTIAKSAKRRNNEYAYPKTIVITTSEAKGYNKI